MKKNNGSSTLPASHYIVWSTLFIVIPLIIIVFFSFTQETASGYSFTLENFKRVLNSQYVSVFRRSLVLAFQSTVLCLILGYPVAYFISKMKSNRRNILIMLFIVPMWMNFLLRTYAWLPASASSARSGRKTDPPAAPRAAGRSRNFREPPRKCSPPARRDRPSSSGARRFGHTGCSADRTASSPRSGSSSSNSFALNLPPMYHLFGKSTMYLLFHAAILLTFFHFITPVFICQCF